jgi:hypothetical protein
MPLKPIAAFIAIGIFAGTLGLVNAFPGPPENQNASIPPTVLPVQFGAASHGDAQLVVAGRTVFTADTNSIMANVPMLRFDFQQPPITAQQKQCARKSATSNNDFRISFTGQTDATMPDPPASFHLNHWTYGGDFWNLPIKCITATGSTNGKDNILAVKLPPTTSDATWQQIVDGGAGQRLFSQGANGIPHYTYIDHFDKERRWIYMKDFNDDKQVSNAKVDPLTFYVTDYTFGHLTITEPGLTPGADYALLNIYGPYPGTEEVGKGGKFGKGNHILVHNNDPLHTRNRVASIGFYNDYLGSGGGQPIGGIDWVVENDGGPGPGPESRSGHGYFWTVQNGQSYYAVEMRNDGSVALGHPDAAQHSEQHQPHRVNGVLCLNSPNVKPNSILMTDKDCNVISVSVADLKAMLGIH